MRVRQLPSSLVASSDLPSPLIRMLTAYRALFLATPPLPATKPSWPPTLLSSLTGNGRGASSSLSNSMLCADQFPSCLSLPFCCSQAKIALQIASEDELLLLQATAQSLNLCARDIQDAGRTQIAAGSRTVLGIGPG